jgi:Fe-S oxidoreductase
MHTLIDAEMVEMITSTGNTSKNTPDRVKVLEKYGLPYDRKADNVIITGCRVLEGLPHVIEKLTHILDRDGLNYTFLSKEYCCGNYLYRPAIKARSEEAMAECRSLSKEFIGLNIEKAKELGARRLIIFCSPCYPLYKHAFPEEDIVFYPQVINEAITTIEWRKKIDYYAGCYKLHKKFAPVPMDLKSTNSVFNKINGLAINRISAPDCCYKPDGLKHMIDNVETDYMVHICTGCYFQAKTNMPADRRVKIMMLPEFVDMLQEMKKVEV